MSDFGQGAVNNDIGWGQGASNNDIGWGSIHELSWAGDTDIVGGVGFDADYQAVLDYATTQGFTLPSAGQQILQNQLVVDLKDAGVWSKLDTFANFATDGDSDFALIDWVRLTDYTAVNSPTFTTNQGFAGDGTSSYINTNFNPETSGVNYQLNNASRFYYVNIIEGGSRDLEGIALNATNRTQVGNTTAQRINQSTSTLNNAAEMGLNGFNIINRTSSTNVEIFTGTTQSSRIATSTVVASNTQFILRAGSSAYNTSQFQFYGMGASLVAENTDFDNALNTYMTSL
jgi:hypothetical protein